MNRATWAIIFPSDVLSASCFLWDHAISGHEWGREVGEVFRGSFLVLPPPRRPELVFLKRIP